MSDLGLKGKSRGLRRLRAENFFFGGNFWVFFFGWLFGFLVLLTFPPFFASFWGSQANPSSGGFLFLREAVSKSFCGLVRSTLEMKMTKGQNLPSEKYQYRKPRRYPIRIMKHRATQLQHFSTSLILTELACLLSNR